MPALPDRKAKALGWCVVRTTASQLIKRHAERTRDPQGKARTAARYRRESRVFYNAMETGHPYVATLDPTLIASPGGFPLIEGGKLVGAIGCSGGTGDQDAVICKVGADTIR
jgi:uncharacterized protein GlcG (DUF336 family)